MRQPMKPAHSGGNPGNENRGSGAMQRSKSPPVDGREQPMGVVMQAEGHGEVALRETPLTGRIVAMVPNGEHVEILEEESELVKVRWKKKIEGWARACNVERQEFSTPGHAAIEHAGVGDASYQWLWEVNLDGQWKPMEPPSLHMQLSAALQQGQHSLKFVCQRGEIEFEYEVDFETKTQTNLSTGVRRLVRWTSAEAKQDIGKIRDMYYNLDEVRTILQRGDVVLIKASWLLEQAQHGSVLPRRQDMPPQAAWNVETLQISSHGKMKEANPCFEANGEKIMILSVSYPWLSKNHPDPEGLRARGHASLLEKYMHHMACKGFVIAVFLDWCSLYQKPRSPAQGVSFERALDTMHLWYAHRFFQVCMLSRQLGQERPYADRGWPTFECSVATLVKKLAIMTLDVGLEDSNYSNLFSGDGAWVAYRNNALSTRQFPKTPKYFASELSRKYFTNGHTDRSFVEGAYTRVFQEVTSFVERLKIAGIPYCEESFIDFTTILPQCPNLKYLMLTTENLRGPMIGNRGAFALASALPLCLQLKEVFSFFPCFVDSAGEQAVRSAAPAGCEVRFWGSE